MFAFVSRSGRIRNRPGAHPTRHVGQRRSLRIEGVHHVDFIQTAIIQVGHIQKASVVGDVDVSQGDLADLIARSDIRVGLIFIRLQSTFSIGSDVGADW